MYIYSSNICVADPLMPGVPRLVEVMVYMIVDPEGPPYPHVISILLGEYEILEVSILPLNLPTLLLLLGLWEEMSRMLDPMMDLAHIALLMSMPGWAPPVSSLTSPSISAGSLIALPIIPSLVLPTAAVQLLLPTIAPPMPPLRTSLPEKVPIPAPQSASLFRMVPTAISPYRVAIYRARSSFAATPTHVAMLARLIKW